MMFTKSPNPEVMSIISASILKSRRTILSTAKYTRIPVTTQIVRTEVNAPMTSARYQPNGIACVGLRLETHRANSEIMKAAKSVSKCAASVATARLLDKIPPVK